VEKTVLAWIAALDPPGPDSPADPDTAAAPDAPAPAESDGFRDVHGHERKLVARHRERYAAVQALRAEGCAEGALDLGVPESWRAGLAADGTYGVWPGQSLM
jgi:hypothetical protein